MPACTNSPNVTWGQPPYYVHAMIANTSQPNACEVSMTSSDHATTNEKGVVSAQVSDDGGTVVVRFVNTRPDLILLEVAVEGGNGTASQNTAAAASMWLLHSAQLSDSNTPERPTFVSPVVTKVDDLSKGVAVPGNAFVIVEFPSQ